jgi:hypothetical protein
MFVYVGVNYRATVQGSTAVAVRCEKCFQKYYYQLVCTAVGRSQAPYGLGAEGAKKRALQNARRRLRRMLDTEIVAVPCPHCGLYQEKMVSLLKVGRLEGLRILGIIGAVLGGVAAIIAAILTMAHMDKPDDIAPVVVEVAWGVTAIVLLGGIGALLLRRHKNAIYDPNDPETEQERIERGRRYTITREQAEALMDQYDD